jgi:hypothetical protein
MGIQDFFGTFHTIQWCCVHGQVTGLHCVGMAIEEYERRRDVA